MDAPTTVLVLDDNKLIRNVLYIGLKKKGYDVKTAKTIDEAVTIAKSPGVDIAIVDYGLGEKLTGFDAITTLQRNHYLPVILMSARNTTLDGLDLGHESGLHYKTRGFVRKGTLLR